MFDVCVAGVSGCRCTARRLVEAAASAGSVRLEPVSAGSAIAGALPEGRYPNSGRLPGASEPATQTGSSAPQTSGLIRTDFLYGSENLGRIHPSDARLNAA
jgi:hypothetical protein